MDRGTVLLRRLHSQVAHWQDYIRRCTHGTVSVSPPSPDGEFTLSCLWYNKDGTEGQHSKTFSRQVVFGRTYSMGMNAWALEKKACEYAREVVREVLARRGIL